MVAISMLFCSVFLGIYAWAYYKTEYKEFNFLPTFLSGQRYWISGDIINISSKNEHLKFTLNDVVFYGISVQDTPKRIQISVQKKRGAQFNVGDSISAEVVLNTPQQHQFAGGFNYKRWAYLNGIGAVGYVKGEITQTFDRMHFTHGLSVYINRLRHYVSKRIITENDMPQQILNSSLLTGLRSFLPYSIIEAFRKSGLAHMLAISGLHLGLVAGLIFLSVRKMASYVPNYSLRFNIKIVAAISSLLFTFMYMLLAGSTIPTVRAFILIAILFVAIIIGRLRITLRVLMLAVTFIILLYPESVLTASFQMSFASAFALLMWAELQNAMPNSSLGIVKSISYVKGVVATAFIAGLTTMPIAAFHFGEVSLISIGANLLAVPLLAFWILPLGVLALFLMPFSLEFLFLWLMEIGSSFLIKIAEYFANTSLAGVQIPHTYWALLLIICWLSVGLWILSKKKYSVVVCVLGLFISVSASKYTTLPRDVVWISGGDIVYMQSSFKTYKMANTKNKRLNKLAQNFEAHHGISPIELDNCDALACVIRVKGKTITLMSENYTPTGEDCANADIIFTTSLYTDICDDKIVPMNDADYAEVDIKNINKIKRLNLNETYPWGKP